MRGISLLFEIEFTIHQKLQDREQTSFVEDRDEIKTCSEFFQAVSN